MIAMAEVKAIMPRADPHGLGGPIKSKHSHATSHAAAHDAGHTNL